MKYLVTAMDPQGCPRAWGVSDDAEAAKARCFAELAIYKARKAEVGDPLAHATYTYETHEVQETN